MADTLSRGRFLTLEQGHEAVEDPDGLETDGLMAPTDQELAGDGLPPPLI